MKKGGDASPPLSLCMDRRGLRGAQLHPLVAPHVSHFSQVPLRTIV